MNYFTSLVIFSIVVLHQADFELNILQTDGTAHAGNAKAEVTGSLTATQKQQHQQASNAVKNARKITTHSTLKPAASQTKDQNKITDPVHEVPPPDAAATVPTNHEEERIDNVATDHSSNQNAPVQNTNGVNTHDNVDTPVSDVDKKVSVNVDNGDDVKHINVKDDSRENDNLHKFSHVAEVRPVDRHDEQDAIPSEAAGQLHIEPKIIAHDPQENAEGLQQERNVLEMQQEQKITVEEVEEQKSAAQEQQLDVKTIPKVENVGEEKSTVTQEDNQVEQLSKEAPLDDRMVDLSSTERLDDTKGQPIQPNTSVDPVTPEVSIDSAAPQPVQSADDSSVNNAGDKPTQPLEATDANAAEVVETSGKLQPEAPEEKFLNIDDSSDPSVKLLNATTSETSSNATAAESSDEETKTAKSLDVQPSSVQPPSRLGELSPAAVPSTAFVPGEAKSENDSDQKSISELEVPTDMPSFDEWKQKEKEKSKHLEG